MRTKRVICSLPSVTETDQMSLTNAKTEISPIASLVRNRQEHVIGRASNGVPTMEYEYDDGMRVSQAS